MSCTLSEGCVVASVLGLIQQENQLSKEVVQSRLLRVFKTRLSPEQTGLTSLL